MRRIATLGMLCLLATATACGGVDASGTGTDGGSGGKSGGGPIQVTITRPHDGDTFAPGATIEFDGSATDTRSNTAIPNANLVWSSSLSGNIGRGGTVRTALAKTGNHVITLTATAADGTTGTASVTITVQVPPLTVKIVRPQDRAIFQSGATITFQCNVSKGGAPVSNASIKWTSDGTQIGIGAVIQTALPDGHHTIACNATDSAGKTGKDTIAVTLGQPAIRIDQPTNGAQLTFGNTIDFRSTVITSDPAPYLVHWKSDGSPIGTGQNIQTALQTAGTHTITASYTDSKGKTATDSITIDYQKANQPPVVTITQPASDGAQFPAGSTVSFTGSAIDPEDGNISASGTWSDPVMGALGSGATTSIPGARPGKYEVTYSATDSAGATRTATRMVYVTPANSPLASTQMNGQTVSGIASAPGGGTWMATGGGYVNSGASVITVSTGQAQVDGSPTSAAQNNAAGPIAFGATGGLSVCTGTPGALTCQSYGNALNQSLGTRHVNKVVVLPNGTVIAATDQGLFVVSPGGNTHGYDGGSWNGSDQVNDLAVGANGLVYMATGRGLVSYDPSSGSFTRYPTDGLASRTLTAVATRNGQVWVGSDRGISHLTGSPGSWNWKNYGRNEGLTTTRVTCLALDSQGVVWGGTAGGGAFRFDETVGRFLMITQSDGLPSDNILSVYIDAQDLKYFGTDKGLGLWYGM